MTRTAELSENARILLGFLNLPGNVLTCVAHAPHLATPYVAIPSPTFNWDSRVPTPRVMHPECLQELVGLGYLAYGEYERQWGSNFVYTLTEAGKQKGAEILAADN